MTNIDIAMKHFGTTNDIREAGYILTNGKFLDLSEKNNGGEAGTRSADHRDINICYSNLGNTESLIQFMNEGNIRLMPETAGIDLTTKPKKEQITALRKVINYYHGEVILDISDSKGNNLHSVEYPIKTASSKVINDINSYFD